MKGKLISMVDFILEIDSNTTNEFCTKYNAPHPVLTGEIKSCVDQFLQVDAIKHRMFVQYAKFLNKEISIELFASGELPDLRFSNLTGRDRKPLIVFDKYTIFKDQPGFWLEAYDVVDGKRLTKVQDLVGLGINFNLSYL